LYNKGLIYRGVRMVNWDPAAKTALSDEEVIYKEVKSKLYYLKYKIEEAPPILPQILLEEFSPPPGESEGASLLPSPPPVLKRFWAILQFV
jgi:isoleucyl-tRNA synthetase